MKFLSALLAASLLSFAPLSFATDDPNAPILEAFSSSEEVQTAVQQLKDGDNLLKEEKVDVIPVAGGCGFAGCDNRYIVILRLGNRGTNSYYRTVSARVNAPAIGEVTVEKLVNLAE